MGRARTRTRAREAALLWCLSLCFFSVLVRIRGIRGCGSDHCLEAKTSSVVSHRTQDWGRVQRRSLGGPGSYPPRCVGKCGRCSPCRAVHVTVPPGTPVTTEYYPEAWRCKCGNRLYIP